MRLMLPVSGINIESPSSLVAVALVTSSEVEALERVVFLDPGCFCRLGGFVEFTGPVLLS